MICSQPLFAFALMVCWTAGAFAHAAVPSAPSFASNAQVSLVDHQFGTVRVGDNVAPFEFDIFNLSLPGDTVSAMTLEIVQSIGNSDELVLPTLAIQGLAAGTGVASQLALLTDTPGFFQISYYFEFSSDDAPEAPSQFLALAAFATVLPAGDYTGDGVVDDADYELWKSEFGTSFTNADGNRDGVVNLADYTIWRDNLGTDITLQTNMLPNNASVAVAIPEPAGLTFLSAIAVVVAIRKVGRPASAK